MTLTGEESRREGATHPDTRVSMRVVSITNGITLSPPPTPHAVTQPRRLERGQFCALRQRRPLFLAVLVTGGGTFLRHGSGLIAWVCSPTLRMGRSLRASSSP